MPIQYPSSFWENCWSYKRGVMKDIKGGILAAGLGSRMKPLTTSFLPKPLFPLGGKIPIAELWVRNFIELGISNISMNLCVLGSTIKRHFKDGTKFGGNITYIEEEVPSGTLGGLCKLGLGNKSKMVLPVEKTPSIEEFNGSALIGPSGDIVTSSGVELIEEMYDIHAKSGAALTMALFPVPWEERGEYGTVLLDSPDSRKDIVSKSGKIKGFIEKDPNSPSNLNNTSIYIIEMELLKILDSFRTEASLDAINPFYDFGKHVFPAMLNRLSYINLPKDFVLWGVQYEGSWFDVGRKRDYIRVNEALLDGKISVELPYERYPWGYLGSNVELDFSKVTIIPPVIIGNNCIIKPGAKIGPYAVIGDGWKIMKDACIKHSVLWERYSFFTDNGIEISEKERIDIDRHEILNGVMIEESIITGGTIKQDVREVTVGILENGEMEILPIDYVFKGPRV